MFRPVSVIIRFLTSLLKSVTYFLKYFACKRKRKMFRQSLAYSLDCMRHSILRLGLLGMARYMQYKHKD